MGLQTTIIWKQYRGHSIAFALRYIAMLYATFLCENEEAFLPFWSSCGIALLTHLCADVVTEMNPDSNSNTIRDLPMTPAFKTALSLGQYLATTITILGRNHPSFYFYMISLIQLSAFGMTLRRKNFLPEELALWMYLFYFAGGAYIVASDLRWVPTYAFASFVGSAAFIFKAKLGLEQTKYLKYQIWALASGFLWFLRSEHMSPCWVLVSLAA